jgi:Tfp pilus assembly protein PilZ
MRARARRFPRRVQVRFWPEDEPERSYAGYSRNISATGMFLATIHPMKPGTRLVIEMRTEKSTFTIHARVMHSAKVSPLLQSVRPSGMGVRFVDRSPGLEELLPADEVQVFDEDHREVFPIYFSTPQEFVEAYDRDIRNGGLFVPTTRPAQMDQEVAIELNLPRTEDAVMTLVARVVHVARSGPEAGMGVAFVGQGEAMTRLSTIVDSMR